MTRRRTSASLLATALLIACGIGACGTRRPYCDGSPGELFERRIKPLLESDRPDSCARCHATGVQLSQFVRHDTCEAMACLKAQGLVDLSDPENSVLLSWIGRAEPESELIDDETVSEEYAAFLEWFRHEAECDGCADIVCPDSEPAFCDRSDAVDAVFDREDDPGDCDQGTLERLFRGTVYENRGRCSPCHFESNEHATPNAPRFIADTGTCQVASLATMLRVVDAGYININVPETSPILTKPLPESAGGVVHEGHAKFSGRSDSAYLDFAHFVERYAACSKQ